MAVMDEPTRAPRAPTRSQTESKPTPPAIREREIGGPKGLEPTRYGDWERNGICRDF